jgi:predicted AAA+ superfamily ATPase
MNEIPRPGLIQAVRTALDRSRGAVLLGPRQCGKTTLAHRVTERLEAEYFDLESPADAARLRNPMTTLERLSGLIVIDEVQRMPDLFPVLRVLLDRKPLPASMLLLGSASPDLVKGASETLAGRVEFVDMSGFTVDEIAAPEHRRLWLRGGFPLSFLARTNTDSTAWRESFVRTFLERDIRELGFNLSSTLLRRFLTMVAHHHGQTWNASSISSSLDLSAPTVRRYLDLMTDALVVRQLPPWFENVGKRIVKSPKIYIRDTGLLHYLLGIESHRDLESHPKYGASWEGYALEQMLHLKRQRNVYFWATYGGAELDLLTVEGGRRVGYEFKCTESPAVTKSMRIAMADLELDHLYVVYPGARSFPLDDPIDAVSLTELANSARTGQ